MRPTIGLPPPDAESCLVQSRVSRYKGGTVINEDVVDLDSHQRRVCDPDGYRPDSCPRCRHTILHVHCYLERRPRGDVGMPVVVRIVQYICASSTCGATWRVLPMFLARHLWRTWRTIERTIKPEDTPEPRDAPPIPEQTKRRWLLRLASSARLLVALFAASGVSELEDVTAGIDINATRVVFVEAYAEQTGVRLGRQLSAVATLTHQLERGMRLM
jgi:hypothetical protein